ncbi:corticotropin-releasing factor receptor 2 [Dermacentor silvarum]|uniref:corticotropin-releasing factor receptor 2 n=1 Tax=Dermacentor silvarum TaxID=543639 RepID=UPI0021015749|nr:corticotropin-releasing factor receptor 2 [Dermacentor silvarum]
MTAEPQLHDFPGLYAYRVCGTDGNWLSGNWTNYTECLGLINQQSGQQCSSAVSLAVVYILLLFSLLSLIFLSASMFIFCYFRCSVVYEWYEVIKKDIKTNSIPVLCKCVLSLKMYAATASINWMFVEGLLLHSRVAVSSVPAGRPFPALLRARLG